MNKASANMMLTNAVGLHARPSVKLTQLAKSFRANIELALAPDGPWTDAKSPVQVMRVKAGRARSSTCALRARMRRQRSRPSSTSSSASSTRSDDMPATRLVGRPAAPGLARGPVVVPRRGRRRKPGAGDPEARPRALRTAIRAAIEALSLLAAEAATRAPRSWPSRSPCWRTTRFRPMHSRRLRPAFRRITPGAARSTGDRGLRGRRGRVFPRPGDRSRGHPRPGLRRA